jgi:hypothetical protein
MTFLVSYFLSVETIRALRENQRSTKPHLHVPEVGTTFGEGMQRVNVAEDLQAADIEEIFHEIEGLTSAVHHRAARLPDEHHRQQLVSL